MQTLEHEAGEAQVKSRQRLLIIDDHTLVSSVVARSLELIGGFECALAENVSDGIMLAKKGGPFDLILLDLTLPGENGISGVKRMLAETHNVPVVIFSGNANDLFISDALNLGARGYIPKTLSVRSMISAIRIVIDGYSFVPTTLAVNLATISGAKDSLSPREMEMLRQFAVGLSMSDLANSMGCTVSVAKSRAKRLYTKLNAVNRAQAVMRAKQLRLL